MFIICSLLTTIKSVRHILHTVEHTQLGETRTAIELGAQNNLPEGF